MKKMIISCLIIVAILLSGLVILQKVNFNRLGADEFYTQIIGEGKKIDDKFDNGEKFVRYEYNLPAFDKEGKQKIFTFTSNKQLRENAYLILFVKDEKGVTSYQEVAEKELPEEVSGKFK
ncbi:YxeA family protein [Bacillus sp. Bva_UNVM-123]|uniref:YxeA family protein n=1 Tax=Bacillus sp. Bva_UNVM-123 TaxID=2829798 RepID=UPI00391F78BE